MQVANNDTDDADDDYDNVNGRDIWRPHVDQSPKCIFSLEQKIIWNHNYDDVTDNSVYVYTQHDLQTDWCTDTVTDTL